MPISWSLSRGLPGEDSELAYDAYCRAFVGFVAPRELSALGGSRLVVGFAMR